MSAAVGGVFRALRVRDFRLFVLGQIVSVAGTWMMVVAQDWLVLGLSGGSASALGTVTALQFAPVLLLTLYGGRLADRYDKRALLTVANVLSCALALVLAVLVVTGGVRLWHVYVFACGLGVVNSVEVPARMAFVGELVGSELLPNASALSAAYFNVARVVGPALSGLLISVAGVGWVMMLNAASYAATVVALRLMRGGTGPERRRGDRVRVVDGLRAAGRFDLVVPLTLVAVIGLFGLNFQLTLPLLASQVHHAGASAFGVVTAVFAAGSLVTALATTVRSGRPSARLVAGGAVAFGVLETAVGMTSSYALSLVLLFLTGGATIFFVQAANHRVQLGVPPELRGRVLALYTLILQGSTPLGALLVGALADRWGVRWGFVIGGLVSLAAGLGAAAAGRRDGTAGPPADEGPRERERQPSGERARGGPWRAR
ncbi:MFS transporter [Streptomyces sp. NPDC014773]|uniref:MFS transporter n=1 Tax=Streptomyces sp. NPDC014773 TaxID=3364908 RepID=UPI003701B36F